MRLSVDITHEQHQRIKVIASLNGQSIKDYGLKKVLPETLTADEGNALLQLEAFLEPRIKAAEDNNVIQKSIRQIFEETHQEMR